MTRASALSPEGQICILVQREQHIRTAYIGDTTAPILAVHSPKQTSILKIDGLTHTKQPEKYI